MTITSFISRLSLPVAREVYQLESTDAVPWVKPEEATYQTTLVIGSIVDARIS